MENKSVIKIIDWLWLLRFYIYYIYIKTYVQNIYNTENHSNLFFFSLLLSYILHTVFYIVLGRTEVRVAVDHCWYCGRIDLLLFYPGRIIAASQHSVSGAIITSRTVKSSRRVWRLSCLLYDSYQYLESDYRYVFFLYLCPLQSLTWFVFCLRVCFVIWLLACSCLAVITYI